MIMVKEVIILTKVIRYLGRICYIPGERVTCFFSCILYLCSRDKIDYDKIPNKEDYIDFITQGTSSKENMTLGKSQKFGGKNNLP